MGEQIFLLVDLIKDRINHNYQIIKENEEQIKNILLEPSTENQSELISKSYSVNRKLRDETNELIKIQIELIKKLTAFTEVASYLIEKLSDISNISNDSAGKSFDNNPLKDYSLSIDDTDNTDDLVFMQTIKGELIYESSHPKFFDHDFFEKLYNHYKETEYYEMCALLLKLKGK